MKFRSLFVAGIVSCGLLAMPGYAAETGSHGAPAAADATHEGGAAPHTDMRPMLGKMQEQMIKMHELMNKIVATKSAKEKEALKKQHLELMAQHMQTMMPMMMQFMMMEMMGHGEGEGGEEGGAASGAAQDHEDHVAPKK